jgi:hypothetical protein
MIVFACHEEMRVIVTTALRIVNLESDYAAVVPEVNAHVLPMSNKFIHIYTNQDIYY